MGDIVVIEDHINLMGNNPLIGPNFEELGCRWPGMKEPYDKQLIEKSIEIALKNSFILHKV